MVEAALEELRPRTVPFAMLADMRVAMSAHVVFTAMDPHRLSPPHGQWPAPGHSRRARPGGLVMSDDLSMRRSPAPARAREAALKAGCDIALHCSGVMDEMSGRRVSPELGEPRGGPRRSWQDRAQEEPFDLWMPAQDQRALAMVA